MQVGDLDKGARGAAAGHDHLHPRGLGRQGAHHLIGVEEPQIKHRVELVEDNHRVELAGNRPLGDGPTPLRFLDVDPGDLIGS